jgi:hypothetical protein
VVMGEMILSEGCTQAQLLRSSTSHGTRGKSRIRSEEHVRYVSTKGTLVAHRVCAVSRRMISLVQPGSTQKEVFGSPNLPGSEKGRGTEPGAESSKERKRGRLRCGKIRALWRELDGPKPHAQGSMRTPLDTFSDVDAIRNSDGHGRSLFLLRDGRGPLRVCKGRSGPPPARSRRLLRTKRGLSSQARTSGEQRDRCRVHHATPGSLGTPVCRAKDHRRQVESRARGKAARCIRPVGLLDLPEPATGEPDCDSQQRLARKESKVCRAIPHFILFHR